LCSGNITPRQLDNSKAMGAWNIRLINSQFYYQSIHISFAFVYHSQARRFIASHRCWIPVPVSMEQKTTEALSVYRFAQYAGQFTGVPRVWYHIFHGSTPRREWISYNRCHDECSSHFIPSLRRPSTGLLPLRGQAYWQWWSPPVKSLLQSHRHLFTLIPTLRIQHAPSIQRPSGPNIHELVTNPRNSDRTPLDAVHGGPCSRLHPRGTLWSHQGPWTIKEDNRH